MSVTSSLLVKILSVAAVAATAVTVTPGSAPAVGGALRHASFQGPISSDHRSGVAGDDPTTIKVESGTCAELAAVGGRLPCRVTWEIIQPLCAVMPYTVTGSAVYTNAFGNSIEVSLYGTGDLGSGVFEGFVQLDRGEVFHMTIDASDACGVESLLTTLDEVTVGDRAQVQASRFTGSAEYI